MVERAFVDCRGSTDRLAAIGLSAAPVVPILDPASRTDLMEKRLSAQQRSTHERQIEPDEAREIAEFAREGRKVLKLAFFTKSPGRIVAAIDRRVDATQRALRSGSLALGNEDAVFLSLQMGCLWGEQLVKAFDWEWTCLTDDGDQYAVASRDRALLILPAYFVRSCLAFPETDCTVALSFNMIAARTFSEVPAHEYLNVLDHVARIVPRE